MAVFVQRIRLVVDVHKANESGAVKQHHDKYVGDAVIVCDGFGRNNPRFPFSTKARALGVTRTTVQLSWPYIPNTPYMAQNASVALQLQQDASMGKQGPSQGSSTQQAFNVSRQTILESRP